MLSKLLIIIPGPLATLLIPHATLTFEYLVLHIKRILSKRKNAIVTEMTAAAALGQMDLQNAESQISISALQASLGPSGVIEAVCEQEGTVKPEDIRIFKPKRLDDKLTELFEAHDGCLTITA